MLTNALDDLVRLQGATKRIKNSSVCAELLLDHRSSGDGLRRNCPVRSLSLLSRSRNADRDRPLDGVVERSLQPVGRLDFPLHSRRSERTRQIRSKGAPTTSRSPPIARRIEIEMRTTLGETTVLKPIEAKHSILF